MILYKVCFTTLSDCTTQQRSVTMEALLPHIRALCTTKLLRVTHVMADTLTVKAVYKLKMCLMI